MSYTKWFKNHAKKHQDIVKNIDKSDPIEYFKWENISKTNIDFCPLFAKNKKCHNTKDLNCYLCACPNFRFNDDGKKVKSWCSINSVDGRQIEHNGIVHQDCSGCTIPHDKDYIKDHFDVDWLNIMKDCKI
jgi:Zn-finger protein